MSLFFTAALPFKQERITIAHITDTHLFASKHQNLLGINTYYTFDAVMNEIEKVQSDYDLLVATGDFVQDGSTKAYTLFAERCASLSIPCFWTPGNHDKHAKMASVFDTHQLRSEKVILLGTNWVLLLLDSVVIGQDHGFLSEQEWDKLTQVLTLYPHRSILIMLHHPPFKSGSLWLDQHGLKNKNRLQRKIKESSNIKAIGCGHIHQAIEFKYGALFFSTPSTCIQFDPNCARFTVANSAPGWRSIRLHCQGNVSTCVHRVESLNLYPDDSVTGY